MSDVHAIPGRLNLAILGGTVVILAAALWTASHAQSWVVILLAALVFSFFNNTMYALMHEAVHRHFHADARINEGAGRFIAAFFPTAFALQRVFHLAHHRNNRTEHERFDYYAPGENVLLKRVQWYSILTGLYWLAPPTFAVIYFFTADLIRWRHLFGAKGAWFAKQTSAQEFLEALDDVPISRVRMDILIAVSVQAALIWALDLSLLGWVLCYAAFGINWSSLQYTDHAFSPLDQEEGAWNLRVHPLVRGIFLNYHYHLVHHRDPSLCWTELPDHDKPDDPSPSFWSIYRQMWAGPRPLPQAEDGNA
ncbi:fatty acid desaturase family protein [Arenibacterium sp. CAU 1754]